MEQEKGNKEGLERCFHNTVLSEKLRQAVYPLLQTTINEGSPGGGYSLFNLR